MTWWQVALGLLGLIVLVAAMAAGALYVLFWRIGKWWDP